MATTDSTIVSTSPTSRRPPHFRNLQPRAAAAIDFNDSDDDDGLLSADYKAQRKTTQDLVDFFKNAPPPPPAPTILLSPFPDDDKKKKGLLQRLRPRKASTSMVSSYGSRSSIVMSGTTSSISTRSAYTMGDRSPAGSTVGMEHGAEVATLANGKKYVMIAVDYKDGTGTGSPAGSIASASMGGGGVSSGVGTSPNSVSSTPPGARPYLGHLPSRVSNASASSPVIVMPRQARLPSEDSSVAGSHGSRQRGLNIVGQQHPNIQVTTTIDENSIIGPDKRRSIIIQAGGGDGSVFSLGQTPFLLDNFALDMDFILQPNGSNKTPSTPSSPSTPSPQSNLTQHHHQLQQSHQQHAYSAAQDAPAEVMHHIRKRSFSTPSAMHPQQAAMAAAAAATAGHHRTPSSKSGQSSYSAGAVEDDLRRQGSRQRGKVTFNAAVQHINKRDEPSRARDDEQIVADALMRRLAAYKAQQERADAKELARVSAQAAEPSQNQQQQQQQQPQQQDQLMVLADITLPKPVSRRKVRHVQIQTQHCIMRPMYTQTDPVTDDYEPQDWPSSRSTTTTTTTTTAMMTTTIATTTTTTTSTSTSTDTDSETDTTETLKTLTTASSTGSGQYTNKAAGPSSTPTAMTMTNGTAVTVQQPSLTSPLDSSPSSLVKENEELRQQVAAMQSQLQNLERELASETRARARTTAAMQDTREKFEMLSAMAYKKLKELIFQRHVLEMEVRELRAQVDLQADEHDLGHHHHHHHNSHQQQTITQVA